MTRPKTARHPVAARIHDHRGTSERIADRTVAAMGSMRFLVAQTVVIACWVAVNAAGFAWGWDPYPFILLNLVFSTQAAYAAPLILLASRRQDAKRDEMAAHDHLILSCLHRAPETGLCTCPPADA